jgi:ABC-type siderophore export system fused ATPase/permease subunit
VAHSGATWLRRAESLLCPERRRRHALGNIRAVKQGWWTALKRAGGRSRETLRVLAGTPRVVRLVWEAHAGYTVALLLLNVAQGLVPLGQAWIAKLLLDAVVAAVQAGAGNGTPRGQDVLAAVDTGATVLWLLGVQGLVSLGSQVAEPARRVLEQELSDHVVRDVSRRILRKANDMADISLFESPRFYDLLQRAQGHASYRAPWMLQQVGAFLRSVIGLVSMLTLLLAFQPLLALAVVVLALPHLIIQFRHQRQGFTLQSMEVPEVRWMGYFQRLLASKEQAKEIRLFGLADFFLGRSREKFDAYHHRHRRLRLAQWRWNTALASLSVAGATGAYVYVTLEALLGRITLGGLTLYISAVNQVQAGLAALITQLAMLYDSNLFVGHIFEFLELPPPMAVPPPEVARPVPVPLQSGIEFRNVAFHYPGATRRVLEDISFIIRPGQAVALVGANGAGSPRWSSCWPASTTPPQGRSWWTDSIYGSSTWPPGAGKSPSRSRTSPSIIWRRGRTSVSATWSRSPISRPSSRRRPAGERTRSWRVYLRAMRRCSAASTGPWCPDYARRGARRGSTSREGSGRRLPWPGHSCVLPLLPPAPSPRGEGESVFSTERGCSS